VSINQRIVEIEIFYKKNGVGSVSKQMGIPNGTFSGMKKEGSNMMLDNLYKVIDYAKAFNPTWIALGIGPKMKADIGKVQELKTEYIAAPSKIMMSWMESMQKRIEELEVEVRKLKAEKTKS